MAYALRTNEDNPINAAFRAAQWEEIREKEAYLRKVTPPLVHKGYRISDLELQERRGKPELFFGKMAYDISYRLVVRNPHSKRMLAFNRRWRKFTGYVDWKPEILAGALKVGE